MGTNGFKVKTENDFFVVICSRCRQNLKFGDFTLLFGGVRQRNARNSCCTCNTMIFPFQPIKFLPSSFLKLPIIVVDRFQCSLSLTKISLRIYSNEHHVRPIGRRKPPVCLIVSLCNKLNMLSSVTVPRNIFVLHCVFLGVTIISLCNKLQ